MGGDEDDRRSMDEVLHSIRRIADPDMPSATGIPPAAEEEAPPEVEEAPVDEEEPLDLTEIVEAAPRKAEGDWFDEASRADRIDHDWERAAYAPSSVGAKDEQHALVELVRRIVREELISGELGRNATENIRRLVADEVARLLDERDPG